MKSELVLQIKAFSVWGAGGGGVCWTLRQLSWAKIQFRGLDPASAVMGQHSV